MRTPLLLLALATSAAALLSPVRVFAADPTAETLYREGRAAAQAQDWRLACEKFRASQEREPAPGTLLNLADCEEKQGMLIASIGHFRAAGRGFRPGDERVVYAEQRATAALARLPRVALRVVPNGEPVTAFVDGTKIADVAEPLQVDPGEHAFVVQSPGHADARVVVAMREGESRTLELVVGPAVTAGEGPSESPRAKAPAREPSKERWPVPALVAFGVAGAGFVVGVATGVAALDTASDVRKECPARQCFTQDGVEDASRGRALATVSTVGFVVALAGAAVGSYLVFRPFGKARVTPAASAQSAGLVLFGEL